MSGKIIVVGRVVSVASVIGKYDDVHIDDDDIMTDERVTTILTDETI